MKLSWKDEKAMIKGDVELHLEWHKRRLSDIRDIKEMSLKDFSKYIISYKMKYWQDDSLNNKITFGYNGAKFNIYDNAKSLAKFYSHLGRTNTDFMVKGKY